MSYDIHLFQPKPGVDPLETAQSELDEESNEINPGPLVPAKEARKKAIASALIKLNPLLSIFPIGFEEIAKFEKTSVAEAKARHRHLEINGPENGNGIQITLFDDKASLTVPYWHKAKKASVVFDEIWKYLGVLQDVGGYKIYDPQLDTIIDLNKDKGEVVEAYLEVVDHMG